MNILAVPSANLHSPSTYGKDLKSLHRFFLMLFSSQDFQETCPLTLTLKSNLSEILKKNTLMVSIEKPRWHLSRSLRFGQIQITVTSTSRSEVTEIWTCTIVLVDVPIISIWKSYTGSFSIMFINLSVHALCQSCLVTAIVHQTFSLRVKTIHIHKCQFCLSPKYLWSESVNSK